MNQEDALLLLRPRVLIMGESDFISLLLAPLTP